MIDNNSKNLSCAHIIAWCTTIFNSFFSLAESLFFPVNFVIYLFNEGTFIPCSQYIRRINHFKNGRNPPDHPRAGNLFNIIIYFCYVCVCVCRRFCVEDSASLRTYRKWPFSRWHSTLLILNRSFVRSLYIHKAFRVHTVRALELICAIIKHLITSCDLCARSYTKHCKRYSLCVVIVVG